MVQSSLWSKMNSLPKLTLEQFVVSVVRDLQYLRPKSILHWVRMYLAYLLHDFTICSIYTKKLYKVGSPAALVRDEIHCNEYPGTQNTGSERRVPG